jgi:hypothetical protein
MKSMFFMLVSLFLVSGIAVNAQDKIQKKDRIHQEDHLLLQDGSCLLVSNGVNTKIQAPLKLNNGAMVNPDGSYQMPDRKKDQLRNGECLDMNGSRYLSQDKFNKRVVMTNKQIDRTNINTGNSGTRPNKPNKGGQK